MLTAVMVKPGCIEFDERSIPAVRFGHVLVQIMRIGVCGSDIHVYHGTHPYTSYPVIQGHEVAGRVAAISADVHGLEKGDRVTIRPQVVCGTCYQCKHGQSHLCENLKVMGFQTDGGGAEFFAVKADNVLKLPDTISYDQGTLIEPLAVAVHALRRSGDVQGKKVLVIGAGPVGNLVAQAAQAMGACTVMIVDINDFRLHIANKCGVDYCVNSTQHALREEILDNFGVDGADLILECAGSPAAISQAIQNARKGTAIVVVGVFGEKPTLDLGLVQNNELRLVGSLMYQESDFRDAINLASSNKIDLSSLITNHFSFRDYLTAYKYIDKAKGAVMKVIIDVQEPEVAA